MDGVVTDWSGSVCKLYNVDPYDPQCQEILRSDEWLQGWKFGASENVDERVKEAGYEFWMNLELLPWAYRLYTMLQKYGPVYFLTSPGKFHAGAHAKLDYLEKHFANSDYILTKHKYLCADRNSILIDDMLKNINAWNEHGGVAWHWQNQYKLKDDVANVDKELLALEATLRQMRDREESLKHYVPKTF